MERRRDSLQAIGSMPWRCMFGLVRLWLSALQRQLCNCLGKHGCLNVTSRSLATSDNHVPCVLLHMQVKPGYCQLTAVQLTVRMRHATHRRPPFLCFASVHCKLRTRVETDQGENGLSSAQKIQSPFRSVDRAVVFPERRLMLDIVYVGQLLNESSLGAV